MAATVAVQKEEVVRTFVPGWLRPLVVMFTVIGALSLPAVASASAYGANSCTTGHISWSVGPSGTVNPTWLIVELDNADSPAGCEQVLGRVLANDGGTTRSGLVKNPDIPAKVSSDGSGLAKAWVEKQPTGNPGARQCIQVYPNVEVNWHPCTG